jgi:pyruvate dehydrogenase E2 component (dihydrolipoyllysine-residue acetyltransferase)
MTGEILMPRLSDGMEEGTILQWLKADGELVRAGDELAEIETDKANMVYESPRDGVLHIAADEGDTLPVGGRIATIGELSASTSGVTPADMPAPAGGDPPMRATSAIAADRARESSSVGSGRDAPSVRGEVVREELSRLQAAVARKMAQSKSTVPDFVLNADVDMKSVVELRAKLKADGGGGETPSINDFIVKAAALALAEFPRANGAYRDGQFECYSRINVGIAVAGQDALVVPTIFDADQKHLRQIATEARAAADRVRSGAITEPELSGGTFTVSNLGTFGIDDFVAIVNQPQAAILAVGAMKETPVVRDGTVVIRPVLRLSLTCDHRIIYGADAAGFLGRIRQRIEDAPELVG